MKAKDEICTKCKLNCGHSSGAKGALATHKKFAHGKHSWKRDAKFDSKEDHETGRKHPGKVYKKRVLMLSIMTVMAASVLSTTALATSGCGSWGSCISGTEYRWCPIGHWPWWYMQSRPCPYTPSWECGNWTACLDGSQNRTCTEAFLGSKTESQACSMPVIAENVTITELPKAIRPVSDGAALPSKGQICAMNAVVSSWRKTFLLICNYGTTGDQAAAWAESNYGLNTKVTKVLTTRAPKLQFIYLERI
jgi:hypothetical protein